MVMLINFSADKCLLGETGAAVGKLRKFIQSAVGQAVQRSEGVGFTLQLSIKDPINSQNQGPLIPLRNKAEIFFHRINFFS
jgi:hypothetical protein